MLRQESCTPLVDRIWLSRGRGINTYSAATAIVLLVPVEFEYRRAFALAGIVPRLLGDMARYFLKRKSQATRSTDHASMSRFELRSGCNHRSEHEAWLL